MIARKLYTQQLLDFIDKPLIKVITGMRRSGKSALLELLRGDLLRRGIHKDNIIYINFESLQFAELREYLALYHHVMALAKEQSGRVYLLLDEIQNVSGWEQAVNSFRVDLDCDIYLTGSNAKLLASELATLLAGRYVEIRLLPLSFAEYLEFAKSNVAEATLPVQKQFQNYLRYGGLPGIHQMKWEDNTVTQYLTDIYNSVILKDVISRNSIRDTALLESIVHYIMDNIGNTFSAKTISDFMKSQGRSLSTETVYTYLRALEGAFIVHKVMRYNIKGKRLLETQEKYYLDDLGLRHAIMGYKANDIGGILENVVYLELLRRGYKVSIGKLDSREVDFIGEKQGEKLYVQVCYLLASPETVEREFGVLESINDNYPKLVLSMDEFEMGRNGIRHMNVREFCKS